MSFNIGSQQADVINNVHGDQTNHGAQNVTIGSPTEARELLEQLRAEIEALSFDDQQTNEVNQRLTEMDEELQQSEPDAASLGARLGRITEIVTSTGALASAGHGLGSAITRLASLLGSFGSAALSALDG